MMPSKKFILFLLVNYFFIATIASSNVQKENAENQIEISDNVLQLLHKLELNYPKISQLVDILASTNDKDSAEALEIILAKFESTEKRTEIVEAFKNYLNEKTNSGDQDIFRRKKDCVCSMCVNCLKASSLTVCNDANIMGTIAAGNIINNGNQTVAGNVTIKGNESLTGNLTVLGSIHANGQVSFGPCNLNAKGTLETNLLNIRGSIAPVNGNTVSPFNVVSGMGFTINNSGVALISQPMQPSGCAIHGAGLTIPITFCRPFLCLPSITALLVAPSNLIGMAVKFGSISTHITNVTLWASNITTCGFNLNIFFETCDSLDSIEDRQPVINAFASLCPSSSTNVCLNSANLCVGISFDAQAPCSNTVTPACPIGGCS